MNLEHELRELPIAFPREPDLEARVRARIEGHRRRRWLVPALVALAAVGALFAIPQTRAAILDFFRIGGVSVERVETQPQAPAGPVQLGREVTLDEAQDAVDFPLLVPDAEFTTYVDESVPGGMVNLRWQGYLLSQWRGGQLAFVQKQVGPGSDMVSVDVDGAPGMWITGARHAIVYRAANGEFLSKSRRLAGNVLIWDRGEITYRLEGARTVAEARGLARNLEGP